MDNYTNSTTNTTLSSDPYLAYLPSLARTLPVQSVMLGSMLTLFFTLFVHLLLTSPYHRPLSKLNWSLQVSAVVAAMLSIAARIGLVLQKSLSSGSEWPYMLDYVEVDLPASTWEVSESAAWYMLEAIVVGLVHITNIQFLSLLFPSTVEVRMICGMLVPLAVLASGVNFASLSSDQGTIDLGDAIGNVCNSTLMLLFAAALAIWGWLNRRRAWRTDGGTAAFGAGAISLAILGAGIGFALIKIDNVQWLTCLGWAVTLWQSFLSWWWWVGSGMGIGEVEELLRTQYPGFQVSVSGTDLGRSSSTRGLRPRQKGLTFLRNRLRRRDTTKDSDAEEEGASASAPAELSDPRTEAPEHVRPHAPQFLNLPILSFLLPLYHRLRTAHLRARVVQFEQSGFLGIHAGWFGFGSRKSRARGAESFASEGTGPGIEGDGRETALEMADLSHAEREEEYGEGGETTATELGGQSAMSVTPEEERRRRRERRERAGGEGGERRPGKWRRHDRTTY
ncbi:hypothetical protein CALVIDRAFT_518241 [Calocera viscosa TUFC12733]|uniref:Uncharacterized protein n=1 Tax=Calocera viscosa (strain TUFC12733) TaxID=1330018 RepID=A0A167JU69_CALVF|nr:hypothetical protein CALVIDRAFT_518241 [Calocera viscosa TUFC12733]